MFCIKMLGRIKQPKLTKVQKELSATTDSKRPNTIMFYFFIPNDAWVRDVVFYKLGGEKIYFNLKFYHDTTSLKRYYNVTATELESLNFYIERGGVKAFILEGREIETKVDKCSVFYEY